MIETIVGLCLLVFGAIFAALESRRLGPTPSVPSDAPKSLPEPVPAPKPAPVPPTVPESVKPAAKLSWGTQRGAYKLTRIICDEVGLTLSQKNILCACIFQESRFRNWIAPGVPTTNPNKDKKTGQVWSTDYGIIQVNDYYHIGKGKTFPSVEYVMNNPDRMVRWMATTMKRTGKLQPWSSYVTGAYKQWLLPNSPMWALKS